MNKFKELQDKHLALLQKFKDQQPSEELIQEVEAYIQEVKTAGKDIPSSQERDQLRANLRFWGAFIFDQKKVFPDIQLWPSTATSSAGEWRRSRTFRLGFGVVVGILLMLLVALAIYKPFVLPYSRPPLGTPTPIPTGLFVTAYPSAQDPLQIISYLATQTALAGGSTTPMPGTPSAVQIETPTLIPVTVIALATATMTEPLAGFIPALRYESGCTNKNRQVTIAWNFGGPVTKKATAYLSRSGTGIPEATVEVRPDGTPVVIPLSDPGSNQSYFLQVNDPEFLFQPIILSFSSQCAYDHPSITYGGDSKNTDGLPEGVDLVLVDWGPRSLSDLAAWIAELSIRQDAGGIYLYDGSLISEDRIFVSGSACSSRPFTLGRASNGIYQEATLALYLAGPLCPHPPVE